MLNKVILVGRLTKDPELRRAASGVSVLNFTVAVQRRFKDANGERQSDFISCVAFRQTAEFINTYFKKGNMISIDGTLQSRTWDDNEGGRRYVTEVIAGDAGFIESRKDNEESTNADTAQDDSDIPGEFGDDDDLPF